MGDVVQLYESVRFREQALLDAEKLMERHRETFSKHGLDVANEEDRKTIEDVHLIWTMKHGRASQSDVLAIGPKAEQARQALIEITGPEAAAVAMPIPVEEEGTEEIEPPQQMAA